DVKVGLMGCLAQLDEGRELAEKFEVDLLIGPGAITSVLPAIAELEERPGGGPIERRGFDPELHDVVPPAPTGLSGFLTIMRGCNHHCTYCVVPQTRGPEVSRRPDVILAEAEAMVAAGALEITLLGQNVNSYGLDQPGLPSFPELLRMVARTGVPRVKFTTSHPMNFSSELIDVIAAEEAVCNYVHLPVQSGSDRVLRRMAREYRRERYLEIVREIRSKVRDVVISTDIIVGFPGETEEDFEQTLSLYDEVAYEQAYMFIYSARPGTPSYKHFEDMPREVKTERLARLIRKQKEHSLRANQALVGRDLRVLVKEVGRDDAYVVGHSDQNHTVLVPREQVLGTGMEQVRLERATRHPACGGVATPEAGAYVPLAMAAWAAAPPRPRRWSPSCRTAASPSRSGTTASRDCPRCPAGTAARGATARRWRTPRRPAAPCLPPSPRPSRTSPPSTSAATTGRPSRSPSRAAPRSRPRPGGNQASPSPRA